MSHFKDGLALEFVPERLKTPALCEVAVRQNGWALEFVPGALRTQELCLDAVRDAGQALQFVPEKLKDAVQTAVHGEDALSAPIQENPQDADEGAYGPRP